MTPASLSGGKDTFKEASDFFARTLTIFKRFARSGQRDGHCHVALGNRLASGFPIQHDDDRGAEPGPGENAKSRCRGALAPVEGGQDTFKKASDLFLPEP